VGEGGNLGLTRRARVEFARGGGRINADFIDNSAGVDCSDHEVNLKVLLGLAEQAGELTRPDRDALLRDVTDEVVEHVLYDSFEQAQIIAQEARMSMGRIDAYEDLMAALEEDGLLDRTSEALPSGEELSERRRAGRGMERPELSLLLTYAKRKVKLSLLESELLDDPWLARDLRTYFPGPVVERFGKYLPEHPLRRQLLATINANLVVNALGSVYVSQLVSERGVRPAEVVRAYRIARAVTGAEADWAVIEELEGKVEPEVQAELMGRVDMLVDAVTRWYLVEGVSGDLASAIEAGREGVLELAAAAPELGGEELLDARRQVAERLIGAGVPEELAITHALRPGLVHAPAVTAVAAATGRSVKDVAQVFVAVGELLPLNELEDALGTLPATRRMERWALQATREDARRARWDIAEHALAAAPSGADPLEAIDAFLVEHIEECRRLQAFMRTLSREGTTDLPGLALAVRQLRGLVE
jgi:glutamate dehydrogenase